MCPVVGSTAGTVQDARAWPSTGFRPPFGLGRVTLERPAFFKKCTKGLLPRQSAGLASGLGPEPTSDGPPQMALWPTPFMASAKSRFEHPCSRTKSGSSCAHPDPIRPLSAATTPSSLTLLLTHVRLGVKTKVVLTLYNSDFCHFFFSSGLFLEKYAFIPFEVYLAVFKWVEEETRKVIYYKAVRVID